MPQESRASDFPIAECAPSVRWRIGTYLGAAMGGLLWVVVALVTMAHPGTDEQMRADAPHFLLLAAAMSLFFAISGAILMRLGRIAVATVGLMLIVAPSSGWVIAASIAIQGTWV